MANYILLAVSIIACLLGTVIKNGFSKKNAANGTDMHLFILISSVVSFLLFGIMAIINGKNLSLFTIVLGIVFGIASAMSSVFSLNAFKIGPASYTTLITMSSMIIPALSGAIWFDEKVGVLKIFGIVLMMVSIFLAIYKTSDDKRGSVRWIVFCLLAALFTGSIGVLQKVHQSSDAKSELMGFLCIAFAVSAIYSGLYVIIGSKKTPVTLKIDRKILLIIILCGITAVLNNAINLYLSGVMESMIFFPTVNGANILLLLLVSVFFLKEKLKKTQWIGIAVGFAAVMLLCLG